MRELVRGFKLQLVGQVLGMLAKGAVILLMTRVFLDPSEYGLLFLAMSIFGVAVLFCSLGLANSAARYVAEYRETQPGQVRHILATALKFNLVTIVVVSAVLVLGAGEIARLLGEPALGPLLVLGVGYVAFRSLRTYLTKMLQGFSRVDLSAAVSAVSSVGLVVFVVGFLVLGLGPLGAVLGYVAAAGLAVVVGGSLLYTRFYRDFPASTAPESGLARRILEYSLPLTATRSANVLDKQIDTVLIGYFLDAAAVGYYTLGKQLTEFLIVPATSLGFTLAPAYGEQKANEALAEAADIFQTSFKYTTAPYVAAAAGLFLVAEPAVRLVFGEAYLGAVPVIQIFSVYVPLRAIDKITSDGLDYLGRARERAIAKAVTATANFLLNVALIPVYGVVGAAGATVFTYSLLVGVELYVVNAELPVDPARMARITVLSVGTAAVMAVGVFLLRGHIQGLLSLALVVLAGAAIWSALGSASGLVDVRHVRSVLT